MKKIRFFIFSRWNPLAELLSLAAIKLHRKGISFWEICQMRKNAETKITLRFVQICGIKMLLEIWTNFADSWVDVFLHKSMHCHLCLCGLRRLLPGTMCHASDTKIHQNTKTFVYYLTSRPVLFIIAFKSNQFTSIPLWQQISNKLTLMHHAYAFPTLPYWGVMYSWPRPSVSEK